MCQKKMYRVVVSMFIVLSLLGGVGQVSDAAEYKVLVVMSYNETFPWVQGIKEGIDGILASTSELKYVYLNTFRNFEGGEQKAAEAYALYQEFQPDGVIAADDNAQTMFVVPYLKDKVTTPVIFCGVNADPETYEYPASNVTGVLERVHFKESIAFAKQLVPSITTIGYIMRENSTARAYAQQAQDEMETYAAKSLSFQFPKTLDEALAITQELKTQCDLLFVEGMEGILDRNGNPLTDKDVVPMLVEAFGKPTITANKYNIENGVLCAVLKSPHEQGRLAAEMVLQAMQGTLIANLPITQNYLGTRIINVTTLQTLGIKPQHRVLVGVELVKTVK